MSPLPRTLEHARDLIDTRLADHAERISQAVQLIDPAAEELTRLAQTLLSGGKRLRPLLCYWSWRAQLDDSEVSDGEHQAIVDLSVALELFQASALVHDDLIDNSETRRGSPTAHIALTKSHADNGWLGEGDSFGTGGAILLGDLLLMEANALVDTALNGAPAEIRVTTRNLFDDMQRAVTVGQYLDLRNQTTPWPSDLDQAENAAWKVIETKTVTYSTVYPLLLGASLACASDTELNTLRSIGRPLGEAFQLRDDLLGVYGAPLATGKPAGDDLREGKRTVLIVRALAALSARERTRLLRLIGRANMTAAELDEALDLVTRSGAVEAVEELIDARSTSAMELLQNQRWNEPGHTQLTQLATQFAHRTK